MKNPALFLKKDFPLILVLSLCFVFSYAQTPLYSSNQNSYFLHGLAQGGYGFLSRDWLANSTDHIPIFSFIVSATYRLGLSKFFYLYHGILIFIYFFSLIRIYDQLFHSRSNRITFLFFVLVLMFIHSTPLHYFIARKIPGFKTLPRETLLFSEGLAGQYILGPYFQPSAFGVFLILSIGLFLQKKEIAATVSAVFAALFHPSYLLIMFLLIAAYSVLIAMDKRYKRALTICVLTCALIAPALIYLDLNFKPTDPEISREARSILINYRLAHHVKPRYWFHERAVFQIFLIVLGILISIRNRKLFQILTFAGGFALLLSLTQIFTKNDSLALLFPWRTSTLLVPISVTLIIGWTMERFYAWVNVDRISKDSARLITATVFAGILVIGGFGVSATLSMIRAKRPHPASVKVREIAHEENVYLIPAHWEWFRLQSGVPIFIDSKSHPYKDIEVIEWHKRTTMARAFYQSGDASDAERNLNRILSGYAISRVIVENNFPELSPHSGCNVIYEGDSFRIYKVNQEESNVFNF